MTPDLLLRCVLLASGVMQLLMCKVFDEADLDGVDIANRSTGCLAGACFVSGLCCVVAAIFIP